VQQQVLGRPSVDACMRGFPCPAGTCRGLSTRCCYMWLHAQMHVYSRVLPGVCMPVCVLASGLDW
jgi:hypothetical protein